MISRHASSASRPAVGLPAGSRRALVGALVILAALLAATTVGLGGWALGRGAGGVALMGAIALLGLCALLFGGMAALVFFHRPGTLSRPGSPGPLAAQDAHHGPMGTDVPSQGPNRSGAPPWTGVWPSDAEPGESMPMRGGNDTQPHPEVAEPADARTGHGELLRRAEGMTSASRRLSQDAEELSACSLDLSALAHGALRRSSEADAAVRAANLDVASVLLESVRETGTDRAALQEIENCLIHARVTRQLLGEFLALASRPGAVAGTDSPRPGGSSEWQDDPPELSHLAADCLQAADTMARLAAESRRYFQAAESASSARMQSMQSLAASLQDLSAASAALIRMNQSQLKYGDTIAHLASQLALGAVCLNDDLQQTFRAE